MSETRFTLPADVIWWNDSRIVIRCPFCKKRHMHGFGPILRDDMCHSPRHDHSKECIKPTLYTHKSHRVPHCDLSNKFKIQYYFVFPLESPKCFEIDKENGRYISVYETDADDDENLTENLANVSISEEGVQISEMLQPPHHHLLTSGRNGIKAITLAAQEGHTKIVKLLLRNGVGINGCDHRGRTALMESALWGRLDTFSLLIGWSGIDKLLEDNQKQTAFHLAENSLENKQRRLSICRIYYKGVSAEKASEEDQSREFIRTFLHPTLNSQSIAPTRDSRGFFCSGGRDSIVYVEISAEWMVDQKKAVAILDRGQDFPRISATSGWSNSSEAREKNGMVWLSNNKWTQKVSTLCLLLDYTLASDDRDNDTQGSFNACHAEKQLIAYFIDKHVFVPGDAVPKPKFSTLELIKPPVKIQTRIFVNKEVCKDCIEFSEFIEKTLGVKIDIHFKMEEIRLTPSP